jgi:TonB family protein
MTSNFFSIAKRVTLSAFLCLGASSVAQGVADPALDHWHRIVGLNTLTAEGNAPFYLKVEFQIFDLRGKPGETGTAEVWWAPHHRYEVIASPSWNETSAPGEAHQPRTRQAYLIGALIDQIIQPISSVRISPVLKTAEADRKFGSAVLRCVSIDPAIPAPSVTTFCVEPSSDILRVNFKDGATVLRSKVGKFRDTTISLDLTTSYGANKAISGKIVALKSIAADDDHFKALPEPSASTDAPRTPGSAGVQAGRKIGGTAPAYPVLARQNHIMGTVVIVATISKEGRIASPTVIATPDPSIADAAVEAVRTWKYQPYLLNGQPTEVDTTILVNFNLGGQP